MCKVELTKHASLRMKERKISWKEVKSAFDSGGEVYYSTAKNSKHKKEFFYCIKGELYLPFLINEKNEIIVLTAYRGNHPNHKKCGEKLLRKI